MEGKYKHARGQGIGRRVLLAAALVLLCGTGAACRSRTESSPREAAAPSGESRSGPERGNSQADPLVIGKDNTVITADTIYIFEQDGGVEVYNREEIERAPQLSPRAEAELEAYLAHRESPAVRELSSALARLRQNLQLQPLEEDEYLGLLAYEVASAFAEAGELESEEFRASRQQVLEEYKEYYLGNTDDWVSDILEQILFVGRDALLSDEALLELFVAYSNPGYFGLAVLEDETGYYICRYAALSRERVAAGSDEEVERYRDFVINHLNACRSLREMPPLYYGTSCQQAAEAATYEFQKFGSAVHEGNRELITPDMTQLIGAYGINGVTLFQIGWDVRAADYIREDLIERALMENTGPSIGIHIRYLENKGYYGAFCYLKNDPKPDLSK